MSRPHPHRSLYRVVFLLLIVGCNLSAAQSRPAAQRYRQIAITQPGDGATVFNNAGHLAVRVQISPAPALAAGDHIALFLDDSEIAQARKESFALDGVDRGTHHLRARIVDGHGNTVIESAPVTFHMWQASKNFPSRH